VHEVREKQYEHYKIKVEKLRERKKAGVTKNVLKFNQKYERVRS
jgi:hypothetical protein